MFAFRTTCLALIAFAAPLGATAACSAQRGGEAIPLERRAFHEVPPPDMTFANRPDAEVEDAAVDAPVEAKAPPAAKHAPTPWAAPKNGYLEQLGSEFKRLRPLPMSEYDVNHTKGRKRQVMNELGRLLVHASRDNVVRIMGPPDSAVRPGKKDWGPTGKQDGRAAERLLYQWRGWKDFLLFELDNSGNVIRSEWSLSKE